MTINEILTDWLDGYRYFFLAGGAEVLFANGNENRVIKLWLAMVSRKVAKNHLKPLKNTRSLRLELNKAKLASYAVYLAFVSLIAASVLGIIVFFIFSKDLPSPDKLTNRNEALSTKLYDRNGELLYDIYGDENRVLVTLDQLPPELINATLAVEDADFYKHKGFDLPGIARSMLRLVSKQKIQGGGSTITQQLVKNALLSPEQTFTRKIKELVLSLQIEKKFTKQEILQMYFNEAPYGGQAWGVEAAANSFFGKSAIDLTPSEAVFLAGLPQSPSSFLANPKAAEARRLTVIKLMEKKGWWDEEGTHHKIIRSDADALRDDVPKVSSIRQAIQAPHFVWFVRQQLEERYGKEMVEQGGLSVETTLDLELQNAFQEIVADEVNKSASLQVGNGALVAIDPENGEILAMVGSKDYFDEENDGNVNVTTRLRQPGSSIKPFTYVTAFKKGYTAATMLVDAKTTFPGGANNPNYVPVNYDGEYRGPIQLRYALANSINVIAVKVLSLVGVNSMLQTAYDMGITTLEPTEANKSRLGLSVTLGGGEVKLLDLTSAYGVFANKGVRQDPVAVLKVLDRHGNVLDEHKKTEGRRVLKEEEAYLISHILSDDNARSLVFGAGSQLRIAGYDVAVKTGTTDDKRDNWAVGYTPEFVVGVWVGNNDNSPMHKSLASGLTGATPIWRRAMLKYLEGKTNISFERPKGIVTAEVDKLSGKKPGPATEDTRTEIFIAGTVPVQEDDVHVELEICEEDDLLANDDCKDDGLSDEKTFIVLKAAREDWQEEVDEWVEEEHGDDESWNPPDEETDYDNGEESFLGEMLGGVMDELKVEILSPLSKQSVSKKFDIVAKINTPFTVTKVEFYLNDILLSTDTSIPYQISVELPNSAKGEQRVTVKGYDSSGNVGSEEIEVKI